MSYVLFKISKLKSEEDFKSVTTEVNVGSLMYYKCINFIEKQPYYINHTVRKNGILALWLQFELHYEKDEKVDPEKWKEVNHKWISLNFPCNDYCILRDKMITNKHYCTYDYVFTSVSHDNGKINFADIFGKNEKVWFADKQRSYDKCMRSSLSTEPAPKYINYQFLHSNNLGELTMPDGFPSPTGGENVDEYCKRVRAYHEDKIKSIRNKQDRIRDLMQENSNLKKELKAEKVLSKAYKNMSEIDQFVELIDLKPYAMNGKYIAAAWNWYKSQGDEDSCNNIYALLDYGRQLLEND